VDRAWIVRAKDARPVLRDALMERGAEIMETVLYETVAEPLDAAAREAAAGADYLLFASGSAVRFFAEAAGEDALRGPRIASIGPATSAELRALGVEPALEADPHTPDGLIAALLADAA
jgi:uroporphyrinogen III methyltransferase / synthase